MENSRWLIRAGALFILIGFVLPSLTVSCGGLFPLSRSYSLSDLASLENMPLLYLVPLGALATIILAFLPYDIGLKPSVIFWGEVSGAALGLFGNILSVLTLYTQIEDTGFDVSPEYGLFILMTGYILVGMGLAMQWPEISRAAPASSWGPAKNRGWAFTNQRTPPIQQVFTPVKPSGAYLRLIRGDLHESIIAITSDNFTIGRDRANGLYLEHRSVSHQHARLRYAQGAWFIQDQGSSFGTFVNGERVPATKLRSGDKISIGDYTFEFHSQ